MNHTSCSTLPHGYRWKVIFDPTGFFTGRIFRAIDLESESKEENGWPDGITFQHISTHTRITVQNGQLITASQSGAQHA